MPVSLDLSSLPELLQCLIDEVRVLRESVDELRDELGWAGRQLVGTLPAYRLQSLPLDPAAADFHEHVNETPADVVRDLRASLPGALPARNQRALW